MADSKISALTETTAIDGTELVYVVEDPSGTPASRKTLVSRIKDYVLTGGTFTGDVSVPDEAYNATTWNASAEVPTKNAVRDVIEGLGGTYASLTSGVDASRPAVTAGLTKWYYATDTFRLFYSDGTAWVQVTPAGELDVATKTANQSESAGTLTDVTDLAVQFYARTRPVYLEFRAVVQGSRAGAELRVQFYDTDGAAELDNGYWHCPGESYKDVVSFTSRVVPAAGTRNYKIRFARNSGLGTVSIQASALSPASFRAYEL